MKTSRGLLIWATLALCGVMVLGAMTWLTRGVLASEKERAGAEARADLEERTRLALWRMDALGASLVLRENSYSAGQYSFASRQFLTTGEPEVLLHFEKAPGDAMPTSPELNRFEGSDERITPEVRAFREKSMARLTYLIASRALPWEEWAKFNRIEDDGARARDTLASDSTLRQIDNSIQRKSRSGDELRKDQAYQTNSNIGEWGQRAKAVAQTVEKSNVSAQEQVQQEQSGPGGLLLDLSTVGDVGQMRPDWVGEELFLLRKVGWNVSSQGTSPVKNGKSSMQGVWLNSQVLRKKLLGEIADLLPDAGLVPTRQVSEDVFALASFPFRLVRNEAFVAPSVRPNGALVTGWIAVALAMLTTILLVHNVMRLSERRASFVSAVTHELRTPLTTFRLYSDMLESGAVKPEKRGDYLRVLSREADRLSHLVENVLSFSKIERGSARSVVRETTVADLLEPMRERLEARLATAGLTLKMDAACALRVRVDTAAVEHILFNLIDNSAKYAAAGDPPEVEIQINAAGRKVEIIVTDHGPGIPLSERRRIFRAFHKSALDAAESRPGVGLGLALSRRLAKSLGGGLECADAPHGACFVLSLPLG